MIYKIKIKDKKSGGIDYVVMGNSYKSFSDHFQDIISYWTKNWHYASEDKHANCFGRTINKEILTIHSSPEKFVSFGGLKMCYLEDYDNKVNEHNRKGSNYEACKRLKEINWEEKPSSFIKRLLKDNRVISEEELRTKEARKR